METQKVAHLGCGCQLRYGDAYDAVDVPDARLGQGMSNDCETVCGLGPLVVSLRRCIHTPFWSRSVRAIYTTTKNEEEHPSDAKRSGSVLHLKRALPACCSAPAPFSCRQSSIHDMNRSSIFCHALLSDVRTAEMVTAFCLFPLRRSHDLFLFAKLFPSISDQGRLAGSCSRDPLQWAIGSGQA